ncbi:uncharacterized protein LOC134612609 [Pelobates fuscus]|uniref:uncharacterized protein LOC134612609 n=1 Tax=Pelobates fuscus TaxID=191477 RepID=UPI002FE44651
MYGREAVFPSEVPVELPLSNIILPEEKTYVTFLNEKKESMEKIKAMTKENIEKSQEKQKKTYAKKVFKKNKDVLYSVGDEVLLYNMRKRGRKGGRIEPDFSGPYIIKDLCGKVVKLENSCGVTLKKKISIDHIKPYRRSEEKKGDVELPKEIATCVSSIPPRTSVICFAAPEKELKACGNLKMTDLWKQLWDHTSCMFLRSVHCMVITGWLMR